MHSSHGASDDDNDFLPCRMQAEELYKAGITHCEEVKSRFSLVCNANLLFQFLKKSSFHREDIFVHSLNGGL